MEIILTCPECGETKFEFINEDGEFKCAACGHFAYLEDMTKKILPKN